MLNEENLDYINKIKQRGVKTIYFDHIHTVRTDGRRGHGEDTERTDGRSAPGGASLATFHVWGVLIPTFFIPLI